MEVKLLKYLNFEKELVEKLGLNLADYLAAILLKDIASQCFSVSALELICLPPSIYYVIISIVIQVFLILNSPTMETIKVDP